MTDNNEKKNARESILKKCRISPRDATFFMPAVPYNKGCNDFLRREFYLCCKLWNVPTLLTPAY